MSAPEPRRCRAPRPASRSSPRPGRRGPSRSRPSSTRAGGCAWPDFTAALGAELARDGGDYWRAWLRALEGWLAAEGLAAPEAVERRGRALAAGGGADAARAPIRLENAERRAFVRRRLRVMQTVYSPRHAGHGGNLELMPGEIVPAFELPRRAEIVRARVVEVGLGPVLPPDEHDLAAARRVHAPDYLDFLPRAWPLWAAAGRGGHARCPSSGRCRGCAPTCRPTTSTGCSAFYSMDAGATFVAGHLGRGQGEPRRGADRGGAGARRARAPPSRSAGRRGTTPVPRFAGGYCFVNNAAVAAEWLRGGGAGAGERARHRLSPRQRHAGDLLRARRRAGGQHPCRSAGGVSLFPRPRRRARRGRGRGVQPQPAAAARHRTSPAGRRRWRPRCAAVAAFAPDALVVSLGVDTFHGDPISRFRLDTPDYPVIGAAHRGARAADALRDGGRLCGRGDRGERGGGAGGVRGGVSAAARDLRETIVRRVDQPRAVLPRGFAPLEASRACCGGNKWLPKLLTAAYSAGPRLAATFEG